MAWRDKNRNPLFVANLLRYAIWRQLSVDYYKMHNKAAKKIIKDI